MATEMSRVDCFDRIHELLDGVEDGDLPWKVGEDTGHFHALKKLSAGIRLVSSAGTSVVSQQIMALKDNVADIAAPRFWQSSFMGIAESFLGAALSARKCPYMFHETCAKILNDLMPWHDQSLDVEFSHLSLKIPDPESFDQPLTTGRIHDVDQIVNIILRDLSIFRLSINPSDLWRYIARRNFTDYITALCDIETLGHMIMDSIKNQLSNTHARKGITMDLEITISRLLGKYYFYSTAPAWVNQLYPYLRDMSLSPTTVLQVKTIGLDEIESRIFSLNPPLSLEHMSEVLQGLHDHPLFDHSLLPEAYPLNWTPFDPSVSVVQAKMTLIAQTNEARLCDASELLSRYSRSDVTQYKGYNVDEHVDEPIIGETLRFNLETFEGSISFQAQRIFAKAVRIAMPYFITTPTDYPLGRTIAEVVSALHSCKWLTDVTSAAILRDAMKLWPPSVFKAEGAPYFPRDPVEYARLLHDHCSQIINASADAATNIILLRHLPEFDPTPDSPHTTTEAAEVAAPEFPSHAPDDSVSKVRAEVFLRNFLRPAFP